MTPASHLDRLLALDRAHVWHPYASADATGTPFVVESAKGVRLTLRDPDGGRREVVDAMASWWCAIHGYQVPEIDAAVHEQLARMSHVMFGGLTHEPAVTLAERLVELTPAALTRVFFSDSGSVAVEVAMKMALQAQLGRGERRRTRFLTIRGGYHGDTFSPMSVTDPEGGMHSLWRGVLPEHVFAPRPPAGLDAATDAFAQWEVETRRIAAEHADSLAGVILEPVLQGAGGMHIYPAEAVRVLADIATETGALLVLDEIATGFWRTGTRWAMDRADVVPDILCLGKALTGGYLSLAATLCTDAVAESVSAPAAGGALMHGPTFMANPLACAIAGASIDLLEGGDPASRVAQLEHDLAAAFAPLTELPGVVEARGVGGVAVVQLEQTLDAATAASVAAAALDEGVWFRPFRDLLYAMPPYPVTTADVDMIGRAASAGVRAASSHR